MPEPWRPPTVELAVVVMVNVTCPVAVTDEGLKLQLDNEGSPLQAKVIAPRPAPLAVTFRTLVAEPPAVTLALVV